MKSNLLLALALQLPTAFTCLTEVERNGGHIIDLKKKLAGLNARQEGGGANTDTVPVATGDRFLNGNIAPRGFGSQPETAPVGLVMNVAEIQSASRALAKRFDNVEYFEAPYKTVENRTVFGIKVGGDKSRRSKRRRDQSDTNRANKGYGVLLQAGIHARERGAPDHLLYFVADLLWAAREGKGVRYHGMSYTPQEVRDAIAEGIVALPLVNPDGAAFDQATDGCWRKNRNGASAVPGDPFSIGVDLNRNFDVAWNFTRLLAPGVQAASTNPSEEAFYGTDPFSEAETKNVRWVMDSFPDVAWFADLHSSAGVVLHGWCHDTNQARDSSQNWRNPAWDGKRGVLPDGLGFEYKEYMDRADWDTLTLLATRVAGGMTNANVTFHTPLQAPNMYPASGCSTDHAYSRHIADKEKKKIYGVGIEFGQFNPSEAVECPFYPDANIYRSNMYEVGAGLMEAVLTASRKGR